MGRIVSFNNNLPQQLATDSNATPDTHDIPPKTETTAEPSPPPPVTEHPTTPPVTPTKPPQDIIAVKPEGTAEKPTTPGLGGPKEE
eukprot:11990020-Karenia_brevis.AAC.1